MGPCNMKDCQYCPKPLERNTVLQCTGLTNDKSTRYVVAPHRQSCFVNVTYLSGRVNALFSTCLFVVVSKMCVVVQKITRGEWLGAGRTNSLEMVI